MSLCVDQCYNNMLLVSRLANQPSDSLDMAKLLQIFMETLNVINVTHSLSVLLFELYLFIPLSVTLTIFQGHSTGEQF